MRLRSNIVAICLTIALVFTSQSMAAARVATDPTGQMILCTGTGTVVVYMDETGAPTQAPHFCPDCTLLTLDDAVVTSLIDPTHKVRPEHFTRTFAQTLGGEDTFSYLSRAPPVLI
jgi:hypothetical protein